MREAHPCQPDLFQIGFSKHQKHRLIARQFEMLAIVSVRRGCFQNSLHARVWLLLQQPLIRTYLREVRCNGARNPGQANLSVFQLIRCIVSQVQTKNAPNAVLNRVLEQPVPISVPALLYLFSDEGDA